LRDPLFREGLADVPVVVGGCGWATVTSWDQGIAALALYAHLRVDRFVPIPTRLFEAFSISRRTKYRMLALLKEAGLIEIKYSPGRTLQARLRPPPAEG
jgi:hypothetical protein